MEANVLALHMIALCEAVAQRGGIYLIEHTEDPGEPYPSIWATQLMIEMERRVGAETVLLDQCLFGGPTRKPTCLSGTAAGMQNGPRRCQ